MHDDSFHNTIFHPPKGCLYGFTVRSTIACGTVKSLRLPKLPRRYLTATSLDIPGNNQLGRYGFAMPYLAADRIDYWGQPLLLLAGPHRDGARRLSERVRIDYSKGNPVFTLYRKACGKPVEFAKGDCETAFRKAHQVVRGQYTTGMYHLCHSHSLEALALWSESMLTVYSTTTNPYFTRDSIADLLSLPKKRIRVIADSSSLGAGDDYVFSTLLAGHASLLSYLAKAPVKMKYSWAESNQFHPRRHPSVIKHETAIDQQGRLMSMRIEIAMDVGAYALLSPLSLERTILASCGGYDCENIEVTAQLYHTNRIPFCGSPGLGEPQAFFALETHTAKIAGAVGTEPGEWKIRNLIKPDGTHPLAGRMEAENTPALVLEDVIQRSDFNRKFGAYEAGKKRRVNLFASLTPLRGIGLAFCFHGIGLPVHYETLESATAGIQYETTKRLLISTSITDRDCHLYFRALASKTLNIPLSDTMIERLDTALIPDSGSNLSARGLYVIGKLVERCCNALKLKRLKSLPPIDVKRTLKPSSRLSWSSHSSKRQSYPALCWEATVVEVEVDPVTLIPNCQGIWVTLDAGVLLDESVACGEAEKAILRDLNFVTSWGYNREAEIAHLNYSFPGIMAAPSISVRFIQHKNRNGPLGMKGLGGQAVIGVPAAFAAAVSQATGCDVQEIPLLPDSIEQGVSQ